MSFDWSNIAAVVLKEIAVEVGLDRRIAATGLAERYGTPPTEAFINDAWHHLRTSWLRRDSAAAEDLAWRLANRNVGDTTLRLTSHEKRLEYLRTCRLSNAVRGEALAVFLQAGSSGSSGKVSLEPSTSDEPPSQPQPPVPPTVPEFLNKARREGRPILKVSRPGAAAKPNQTPVLGVANPTSGERDSGSASSLAGSSAMSKPLGGSTRPLLPAAATPPRPPAPPSPPVPPSPPDPPSPGAERTPPVAVVTPPSPPEPSPTPPGDEKTLEIAGVSPPVAPAPVSAGTRSVVVRGVSREFDDDLNHVVRAAIQALDASEARWTVPVPSGGEWWASNFGATRIDIGDRREEGKYAVTDVRVVTRVVLTGFTSQESLMHRLSELNYDDGIVAYDLNLSGTRSVETHVRLGTYREAEIWQSDMASAAFVASAAAAASFALDTKAPPEPGELGLRSAPSPLLLPDAFKVPAGHDVRHRVPSIALVRSMMAKRVSVVVIDEKLSSNAELCAHHPGRNKKHERRSGLFRGKSDDQLLRFRHLTSPKWGPGLRIDLEVPSDHEQAMNEQLAFQTNRYEWDSTAEFPVWGGWSGTAGTLCLTQFLPETVFRADDEHNLNVVFHCAQYAITRGLAVAARFDP